MKNVALGVLYQQRGPNQMICGHNYGHDIDMENIWKDFDQPQKKGRQLFDIDQ